MKLITVAIHTYERAIALKSLLEAEGIAATLQNVNLEQPEVSSGVRVRIADSDLPLALRVIENQDLFVAASGNGRADTHPRHIIGVPTDFSEHSFKAACIAATLAKKYDADLKFLHAYIAEPLSRNVQLSDNLTYELIDAKTDKVMYAESEAEMKKMIGRVKDMMRRGVIPAVKCQYEILEGVPEDAIVDYVKLNPAYLMVMGTRARGRKEREMIGSVTAEVLDECRFTVLTIPENMPETADMKPKNILFFSNLDQEDIIAIDTLYRYFPDAGAKVTIVHVPRRVRFTDKAAGRSAMALSQYCSKKFKEYTFESVPLSPKTAVDELASLQKNNGFDLIVVPNRRTNAFSRLFNPGLAHKILFEADIPMLVIPV